MRPSTTKSNRIRFQAHRAENISSGFEGREGERAVVVCEIPSNAGVVVFKTFQSAFAAPPSHRFKLSSAKICVDLLELCVQGVLLL